MVTMLQLGPIPLVSRQQFDEAFQELKRRLILHRKPVAASGLAIALVFIVALSVLLSGLPDREQLRTLGEMPQATTLYDVNNRPVFTIFKEYRIEVPLARSKATALTKPSTAI